MLLLTLQKGWSGLLQGVRLILANQFISQIREANIMQSLFGNVGILASFRLGIYDAAAVESQFLPYFDRSDLSNLPNWQACVKAKIQGQTPAAFTMNTLLPAVQPSAETAARVRAFSQQTYGRPRAAVEEITSKRVKTLKNHKPESFTSFRFKSLLCRLAGFTWHLNKKSRRRRKDQFRRFFVFKETARRSDIAIT